VENRFEVQGEWTDLV